MTLRALAAIVTVPLALSACNAIGPRTLQEISPIYTPGDLDMAARRGSVPVVVLDGSGGSLAGGSEALQRASLAALPMGTTTRANFIAVPQAPTSGYKVVLLFNGPAVTGDALCRATATPGTARAPSTGQTHVMAAFCSDQRMLTEVEGFTSAVKSVDDPALGSLLRQVALDLFPSRDARTHDVKPD